MAEIPAEDPHPGVRITPEYIRSHHRKSSIISTTTPEQLLRTLRERSRESYQKIIETPSATLQYAVKKPISASPESATQSPSGGFKYAATPAAATLPPSIATQESAALASISSSQVFGGSMPLGCISQTTFSIQRTQMTPLGCMGTGGGVASGHYLEEMRCRVKDMFHNFPITVSVNRMPKEQREKGGELTLRIKNNKIGHCVFEVVETPEGESIQPVENLKTLFPHDKQLVRSLIDWNNHFQHPPPHWIINFIPRAYLRRGYHLAEEVCEYFTQHPDGCKYRIEYEPIGHEYCLVGSVVPIPKRVRRERYPSRYWEKREKIRP